MSQCRFRLKSCWVFPGSSVPYLSEELYIFPVAPPTRSGVYSAQSCRCAVEAREKKEAILTTDYVYINILIAKATQYVKSRKPRKIGAPTK